MKRIIISLLFASVVLTVACTREIESSISLNPIITVEATNIEPDFSRTTLQDNGIKVYWEPQDEIAIFYNGSCGRFVSQNEEPALTAKFEGTLNAILGFNEGEAASNPIWGLYPYCEDASSDKLSVTTVLPAEQIGRAGSFARNTQITLARANSLSLGFYNVTGGLRFSLSQEGINAVSFEGANGEILAGTIKLAFENGAPVVQEVTEGKTRITLTAPDGDSFQTGQWYYLAAIPGALANGFKMTFYKDNEYAVFTSDKAVNFKRGIFGSLTAPDPGLEWKNLDFVYIPDPVFREYMITNFDTNKDGRLGFDEAANVIQIRVNTDNIYSLTGIEYCKNLSYLSCCGSGTSWNSSEQKEISTGHLAHLDLSKNTKLYNVYCNYNKLLSLNVSSLNTLSILECNYNQLYDLDVSDNNALTSLDCHNNQLTSLDMSNNSSLSSLSCRENRLTNLDVRSSTSLTQLHCGGNQLKSLDISNNIALSSIRCANNLLESLDVSHNLKLEELECSHNRLTSLDVSKNLWLSNLQCAPMNDAMGSNLLDYLYILAGQTIPYVTANRSETRIPVKTSIITLSLSGEDANALLSEVLSFLYSADSWYPECRRLFNTDRFTDDWNQRTELYDWVGGYISADSPNWIYITWTNLYKGIAAANRLLGLLSFDCNDFGGMDTFALNGEAKFCRASFYMYLVAMFGDVPFFDEKGLYEEALNSGRATRNELMGRIYQDFDDAAQWLPTVGENGHLATRGAALAMKARAALLVNDWQTCAAAAKACIDLGVYSLHPDYRELFLSKTKTSPELIFALQATNEHSYADASTRSFYPRNNGGTSVCQPSWELFFAYTCTDGRNVSDSPLYDPANPFANRDPRLSEIAVPFDSEFMDYVYNPRISAITTLQVSSGTQVTNKDSRSRSRDCSYNGLILKKFVDEEWIDDRFTDTPMRIMRYADVLLMYAESKMELGQIDQSVFNALNSLRARAYKCSVGDVSVYPAISESDQSSLRRIIRNERRCELAWENRRWFDIIRWRTCSNCLSKPVYGLPPKDVMASNEATGYWIFPEDFRPVMQDDSTIDISGIENYPGYYTTNVHRSFSEDWRYLLPIPAIIVASYPLMTQNPGY